MSERSRLVRSGTVAASADGALRIVFEPERDGNAAGSSNARCSGVCGACATRPQEIVLAGFDAVAGGSPAAWPGDRIEISVDAAGLVRAAGLTFGIPLAAMLTGAWLGSEAIGEAASVAFGIVGLGVGLGWLTRRGDDLVALLGLRVGRSLAARTLTYRRSAGIGSSVSGSEI